MKAITAKGKVETVMAERILKTSISLLDSFNRVRNEHSQAHDNSVVGYHEALLIFNNIVALVRFLDFVEQDSLPASDPVSDFEIPF